MIKKGLLIAVLVLFIAGCGTSPEEIEQIVNEDVMEDKGIAAGEPHPDTHDFPEDSEPVPKVLNWRDIVLKDINSGETFAVSDFADKPILLESFAVWCPTCTAQQRQIRSFHEVVGDDVVSISADTDPNEDETKVKLHTQANGFNWRYVVSPKDFTKGLIDEFGITVVNAPLAPVVLICPGEQIARLLGNGVKDVEELQLEIARC